MKGKRKLKLIGLCILSSILLCSYFIFRYQSKIAAENETKKAKTDGNTYQDRLDSIVISAFHPLSYPELLTQEQFDLAAEAGIDVMEYCAGMSVTAPESMKQALGYAANAGILVNVFDDRISSNILQQPKETVFSVWEEYRGKPGLGGYYLIDESVRPNDYAWYINELKRFDPSAQAFINNFPDIWGDGSYQDRLSDLCHLVVDKEGFFLSFDNYPFGMETGSVDETSLFKHFDAVRKAGLENQVRTGFYAQSIQYGYRKLNGNEMRYHVNSALAYGFKAIKYFAWGTPNEAVVPGFGDGVIDPKGNPTALYYDIKEINKYAHTIGTTLVNLDAVEIYHSGSQSTNGIYKKLPENYFVQTDDYTILSRMVHQKTGRNYLMIVNKDFSAAQTVTLNFTGVDALQEISPLDGKLVPTEYQSGILRVSLDPGAAILLALPEGKCFGTPEETAQSRNLLQNAYVLASGSEGSDGWYVNRINDGIRNSQKGSNGWRDAYSSEKWLQFDLNEKKQFNRLDLYPAGSQSSFGTYFPQSLRVQISDDGNQWSTVLVQEMLPQPTTAVPVFRFDMVSARYVRLSFSSALGEKYPCELAEAELFADDGNVPLPPETTYEEETVVDNNQNIALNKPIVDYSSNYETPQWNNSIHFITDGDHTTNWASDIYAGHSAPDGVEYITIDLQSIYTLNRVQIYPYYDYQSAHCFTTSSFPEDYDVQVSLDGVSFQTVAQLRGGITKAEPQIHEFSPIKARYVRIYVTKMTAHASLGYFVQFSEVEVFAVPNEKAALQAAIAQTNDLDTRFYTNESVQLLLQALEAAQATLQNSEANDQDYQKAKETLLQAKSNLREVDLGANVARDKSVTATSDYKAPEGIFDASYLTDGLNPDTKEVYKTHNGWSVNPGDQIERETPVELQIDLGKNHIVTAIFMYPARYDSSTYPECYELYTSVNGDSWQLVGHSENMTDIQKDDVLRYKVDNVLARYIKIRIARHSGIVAGSAFISQLGEAEVFGKEFIPADTDELRQLLKQAKDTDRTGKTEDSLSILEEAIQKAEEVLQVSNPTQETVEEIYQLLQSALNGLKDEADNPVTSSYTVGVGIWSASLLSLLYIVLLRRKRAKQ